MEKVELSFVVPFFNVGNLLEKCLTSILSQKDFPFEIILIDDGSTDCSTEIAKKYENNHKDIVHYIRKDNGGLSSARNLGVSKSCGKYISFVDSDDYLASNFIEVIEPLLKSDYDIVRFNFYKITKYNKTEMLERKFDDVLSLKKAVLCDEIGNQVCKNIFKRSLISESPFKDGVLYEDLYWTHEIYFKTNNIVSISDCIYCYFMRDSSISHASKKKKIANDVFYAFLEKVNFAGQLNDKIAKDLLVKKTIDHALTNMLYANYGSKSYKDCKFFIKNNKNENNVGNRKKFIIVYYFNFIARMLNFVRLSN